MDVLLEPDLQLFAEQLIFRLITIIIFIEIVGMLAFLFHCVALIQDHRLNSSSSSNGLSHQYEDCSGP